MAKSITDSDTIPTDADRQNAKEMFQHGETLDVEKMAHTVARLHRKESTQQNVVAQLADSVENVKEDVKTLTCAFNDHCEEFREHSDDVTYCLKGDKMGAYGGMIKEQQRQGGLVEEIYETVTRKDATTKKVSKESNQALSGENNLWVERAKGVITVLAWLALALIAWFK